VNTMRNVFLIMTATLLGACGGGSTTLKSEKLSPAYQGPPRHVLVMAMGMSQASSVLAENNLAEHLTLAGVRSSKAQQVFGSLLDVDQDYILRRLAKTDMDAVLVLRLDRVHLESKGVYRPERELGKKAGLQLISEADVTGANQRIVLPSENVDVLLRINFYDLASQERVWTAVSESFNAGGAKDIVKAVGKKVTMELKLAGVL
jgi:hypothetical protein